MRVLIIFFLILPSIGYTKTEKQKKKICEKTFNIRKQALSDMSKIDKKKIKAITVYGKAEVDIDKALEAINKVKKTDPEEIQKKAYKRYTSAYKESISAMTDMSEVYTEYSKVTADMSKATAGILKYKCIRDTAFCNRALNNHKKAYAAMSKTSTDMSKATAEYIKASEEVKTKQALASMEKTMVVMEKAGVDIDKINLDIQKADAEVRKHCFEKK